MPSLVLFGKRTLLAGDDLAIWSFVTTCIKIAIIVTAIPLFVLVIQESTIHATSDACANISVQYLNLLLHLYTGGSLLVAVLGIGVALRVRTLSATGTPTIPGIRRQIQPLCHFNLTVLFGLGVALLLFGTMVRSGLYNYCTCDKKVRNMVHCGRKRQIFHVLNTLIKIQYADFGFLALMMIYFGCLCLPKCCVRLSSQDRWKCFCRCCCTFSTILTCCLCGWDSVTGDFSDVALILSDYFDGGGHVDVVPSDIFAGILMVARMQTARKFEAEELLKRQIKDQTHGQQENGSDSLTNDEASMAFQAHRSHGELCYEVKQRDILKLDKPFDRLVIAEGAHYMRLSQAIYTWAMKMINEPCTGLCELTAISSRTAIRDCCKKQDKFVSDTPCRFHKAALMSVAGLEEKNVVYAQFKVSYTATPYCIVLDHDWKTIVISIRGTQSLDDVLADLSIRPVSLENYGDVCGFDGKDKYVHSGILGCSVWIYRDIEKVGKLSQTVAEYSNYEIRLTGHSLGAGCASILAILLRPKYPSLRVIAFSPPGCVMSRNVAVESEAYTTSYVLDCDLVPRLSLQSVENLRNDVLKMIDRIKVPKQDVLNGRHRAVSENSHVLHDPDRIPDTPFHTNLSNFWNYTDRHRPCDIRELELCPPGKIVHLSKTSKSKTWSFKLGCFEYFHTTRNYTPCWADETDLKEIRMSYHMVQDHQPATVLRALEDIAEKFGLEAPYNHACLPDATV